MLHLVKSIMHVFSLDKTIDYETRLLRKDLLSLFDIREFSPHARFENPSSSLTFSQLICDYCTMVRDLDLCRDEDVLPPIPVGRSGSSATEQFTPAWRCTTCAHEYDRLALEERLIGRVYRMVVQWQTQDLQCAKCKRIRINDFMEHCGCSGTWVTTMSLETVMGEMKVMNRVAAFYGLKMLAGVVADMLPGG